MKSIIQILLFFFPWKIRRFLLIKLFNWDIHSTARVGKSIILSDKLIMNKHTRIGSFTWVKTIDKLEMADYALIGNMNFITGFSTKINGYAAIKGHFEHNTKRKCELILGEDASIVSRHYIDCNGGIYIGKHSLIAGVFSQILTHGIDIYNNRQDSQPVILGDYCSIGTGSIILKGTVLPNYSIVGAGSVLNKIYTEPFKLYGGVPATIKKDLNHIEVKFFIRDSGIVI